MKNFDSVLSSYDTFVCEDEKDLKHLCKLLAARGYQTTMRRSVFAFLHMPVRFPEVYKVRKDMGVVICLRGATESAITMSEVRMMLKSNDNSTRTWVRNNLPESWLQATKKFKCQEEMIRRICSVVPTIYRNQFCVNESRNYIQKRVFGVRTHIRHLIDMSDADMEKWNKVGDFILNYEESCR